MSRGYSVRTAALTLGVSPKWVDNILSHHDIPGVVSARQGVERAISDLGMRVLELVRIASSELGIPVPRSVEIAVAVATSDSARFVSSSGVELRFSIDAIDRRLRERLMDAIEATPQVRRGRPPKKGRAE